MSDADGTTYHSHPVREVRKATGMYLVIFRSLSSSSLLLTVFISVIFFCKDYQLARWGGAGQDQRGRRQKRGIRRGGEATGTCYVIFCSLLYSFLPLTFLLLIVYVRQQAGRDRAGRNRTDVGGDSNKGRDRGAGGREQEVEGRADGLRRRAGR